MKPSPQVELDAIIARIFNSSVSAISRREAKMLIIAYFLSLLPEKSTLETIEKESQEYADGRDDVIDLMRERMEAS